MSPLVRRFVPPFLAAIAVAALLAAALLYPSPATRSLSLACFALAATALAGWLSLIHTLRSTARALEGLAEERESCERQHGQLVALNAISEAVNRSLDLDTVLNEALDQVLGVMRMDAGDMRLLEGDSLRLVAARRVSPQFIEAEQIIPLGQCACGKAAEAGRLIVIEDLPRALTLQQIACACERFGSVLSVPISTAERVVGVLHAGSRTAREFSEDEREMLTAVGHQVGAAVEKAQLHGSLETLTRELEARVETRTAEVAAAQKALAQKADALHHMLVEERRIEEKTRARIAHDLHDGVQQFIIAAMFETQAARDALRTRPEVTALKLAEAQNVLRRVEAEMRAAIYSLRPVALDAHGLVPALRECTAAFQTTSGIPCSLKVNGTPRRFDPDAEVVAFRIAQEALNNVEAHSRASRVEVRVCFGEDALHLTIADDGQGFDTASVGAEPRSHLGLIGMDERAESIGGRVTVRSEPGEGTEVRLVIPAGSSGGSDPARDLEECE